MLISRHFSLEMHFTTIKIEYRTRPISPIDSNVYVTDRLKPRRCLLRSLSRLTWYPGRHKAIDILVVRWPWLISRRWYPLSRPINRRQDYETVETGSQQPKFQTIFLRVFGFSYLSKYKQRFVLLIFFYINTSYYININILTPVITNNSPYSCSCGIFVRLPVSAGETFSLKTQNPLALMISLF